MDNADSETQLDLEMAAISAVKSEKIVELAREANVLDRFQNRLDESLDRVQLVKEVLTNTEPYQVTPELATALDNQLARVEDIEIPPPQGADTVMGAEALGITLMPRDYILTRLAGCENFMGDFYKKSREVAIRIGSAIKESYILIVSTHENLETALTALESTINATPNFDGKETVVLGSREYNLFKVNGKISEDWGGELNRLSRSIAGISANYYLTSRNNLNSIMSFFGGFSDADAESGKERFLMLPTAVRNQRFKECNIADKQHSTNGVVAMRSVELMGGAYFLDVRLASQLFTKGSTVDGVQDYIDRVLHLEMTGFENSAPTEFPRLGNEIKTLGTSQIKMVIKHLRETLKEWRKVFEGADKFKLSDSDFQDITKGIYESAMPEDMKSLVLSTFNSLVQKNQMELLNIRVAVNTYLVLIINALIGFCNDSIRANAPRV